MAAIDTYLDEMLVREASDLHFMAGAPPRIRQYGKLMPLREELLTADLVQQYLTEIMSKKAADRLEEKDGCDFAYTLGAKARFRVNVLR
ncbi:MAG: type IV pili twitching motility protein PilT, partial [Steroidobacteraceae bacterium]